MKTRVGNALQLANRLVHPLPLQRFICRWLSSFSDCLTTYITFPKYYLAGEKRRTNQNYSDASLPCIQTRLNIKKKKRKKKHFYMHIERTKYHLKQQHVRRIDNDASVRPSALSSPGLQFLRHAHQRPLVVYAPQAAHVRFDVRFIF